MTFLPIVDRELRVAARRPGTYWGRLTIAGAAIAIAAFMAASLPVFFTPARAGASVFQSLAWFALVMVLLAGPRATADCLSAEKRDGTLGLLFLTDLKGYDVVLGKLVANSLRAFYGLVAILPVLAIPILMGGVSAGQFWRVALALVNALLFSLAVGMCVSAVSRVERKAVGATTMLVLGAALGPEIIGEVVAETTRNHEWARIIKVFSPGYAMGSLPTGAVAGGAAFYWFSLGLTHGLTWLLLALASLLAPRVWQDKPGSRRRQRWREWWHDLRMGDAARRAERRRRLLAVSPILWLHHRRRFLRFYPWVFLAAMLAVWVWGFTLDRTLMLVGGGLVVSYLTNLVLKYWVATTAAYGFAADREQGALELLLATPLTVEELVRGQCQSLRHLLAVPLAVTVAAELALVWFGAQRLDLEKSDDFMWVMAMLMGLALLLLDCWALQWVGLWQGARENNAHRAASTTTSRILSLPCLALAVVMPLLVIGNGVETWQVLPILWFAFSVVADIAFGLPARGRLFTSLRAVATERFTAPPVRRRWWRPW
jgi:ABC-type transport system involved in cytochrome c biogenesis permease component